MFRNQQIQFGIPQQALNLGIVGTAQRFLRPIDKGRISANGPDRPVGIAQQDLIDQLLQFLEWQIVERLDCDRRRLGGLEMP
jgi:hypothetical protein